MYKGTTGYNTFQKDNMNKHQAIDILKDYTDLMEMQRLLLSLYKLDSKERVKRGPLQRSLAHQLDLNINLRFYLLLDSAMDNLPVKEIIVQGVAYYKGLILR